MDILNVIKQDHEAIKHLFNQLEKHTDMPDKEVSKLINDIILEIKLHSKAEEIALYEACNGKTESLDDFSKEGFIEHRLLATVLNKLPKVKPGKDGEFKALVKVARDLFEHHAVEEEQEEIFPKLKSAFSNEELRELGDSMLATKEELRGDIEKKIASQLRGIKPTKSRLPASLQ
jgi:hemerythrin superfamily protein